MKLTLTKSILLIVNLMIVAVLLSGCGMMDRWYAWDPSNECDPCAKPCIPCCQRTCKPMCNPLPICDPCDEVCDPF